jgi:hypothetical protein
MAKNKGDGHFSKAPKLTELKGDKTDPDASTPGKSIAKDVYSDNSRGSSATRNGKLIRE